MFNRSSKCLLVNKMDPIESVKMDPNGSEGICEMVWMDPNGCVKIYPYGIGGICENGFK